MQENSSGCFFLNTVYYANKFEIIKGYIRETWKLISNLLIKKVGINQAINGKLEITKEPS